MKKTSCSLKKLRASSRLLFGFAATGASVAAFAAHAGAQTTIIDDNFTSGSNYGTQMNAPLAPAPVNLPGGTWGSTHNSYNDVEISNANTDTYAAWFTGSGGGAQVSLSGFYNSGSLTLTAGESFTLNSPTNPVNLNSNAFLGFSDVTAGTLSGTYFYQGGFTGLVASGSTGAIQEYVNGASVGNPAPFTGSYSAYANTVLSYTINTATGAISGVSFGDSTTSYSSYFAAPNTWSSSYLPNLMIAGSTGMGGSVNFENLSVVAPASAVPEPSAYASLAGGIVALGAFQYRRRQRRFGV